MSEEEMTVHVVDDDEAILHSIGFLLRKAGHRVKTYASGMIFLNAASRTTKGCLVLDIRMPDVDGLEVQRLLADRGIGIPIIMLTGHGDVSLAVRAIKAGAIEFLEKPFDRTSLLAAIDQAFAHARHSQRSQIDAADAVTRLHVLTARERDVLEGMVLGQPNKLIAYELDIASRTVEVHRANLMTKLGCRSLSDVLRIAFAAGLGIQK
jgi:two-component system response regulator FixJ